MLILVEISYSLVSSKDRWLTLSSTFPKPTVCILPVIESEATSAKFASALTTAAQPPSLSKPAERNSLNQISALFSKGLLFLTPNIIVLI